MSIKLKIFLLSPFVLAFTASPLFATLVSMSASGLISINSSTDPTIPVGTPWAWELIYDTAAPDRDFELTATADPTFGRFVNAPGGVPAMTFFHYRAGTYDVTLDDPGDFGPSSSMHITFTDEVHAIDINLFATALFPPLAGGSTSFHADFNDFSHTAFASDALPTNTAIGLQNFQDSSVTLLPFTGGVVLGSQANMTSFRIAPVPEPVTYVLALVGLPALLSCRRSRLASISTNSSR